MERRLNIIAYFIINILCDLNKGRKMIVVANHIAKVTPYNIDNVGIFLFPLMKYTNEMPMVAISVRHDNKKYIAIG